MATLALDISGCKSTTKQSRKESFESVNILEILFYKKNVLPYNDFMTDCPVSLNRILL